jgi:dTDP-4-dehydrorhamnose 3,5-epimerase
MVGEIIKMIIENTFIEGLKIITPAVFGDNRGWFFESYSEVKLRENGINITFVQDNHSFSEKKGTLRGLHFQNEPMAQTKLVRCTRGALLDVAVDLRPDSPTYKQWFSVELSAENKKQLLIPKGFAHGFLTLTDDVEIQYKTDEFYSKEHDCSIRYDDPEIGIDWGFSGDVILSEKDVNAPFLKDAEVKF